MYVKLTGPNDRIQKFTADGTFIASWGSSGTGNGQFHDPDSIAIDSSGNVYVADWDNNRIQVFAPSK
jgi:DNA-binding beta-propeller fold protein YncE